MMKIKLNNKGMEYIPFLIYIGLFLFALLVASSIIAYNSYYYNKNLENIEIEKAKTKKPVVIQKEYTRLDYLKYENELVQAAKLKNYDNLKQGESIKVLGNELKVNNEIAKHCTNTYVIVKRVGEINTYKAYIFCDKYRTEA